RAVERDEQAALVARRKRPAGTERERQWRPVRRVGRQRLPLAGAGPDGLAAVAAVLRRQHQPFLRRIEVALGPAVVGAALHLQQLFARLGRALARLIQVGPVLGELVPPVL